jgi:putative peptidoglycan lipid II flippase
MGMQFSFTLGRDLVELRTVGKQMAPRVIGQAAAQLSLLVTAALTARLVRGAEHLTGLEYAYQLMLLPYGIFSLSLSTVAFPRLARLFAEQAFQELRDSVRRTLRVILLLTLPATIALVILAVPLVRLLFQRGEFDETSLIYTVVPLLGYATALPAFSVSEILIRTFFAMQQTKIPVLIGILQVSLNLMLGSLALMMGWGVGALALAFSIANNIEALLLFVLLGRQLPGIWQDRLLWRGIRAAVLATLLLAGGLWAVVQVSVPWFPFLQVGVAYSWQQDLVPMIGWMVGVGTVGVVCYAALAALAGSEEARMVWRKVVSVATSGK